MLLFYLSMTINTKMFLRCVNNNNKHEFKGHFILPLSRVEYNDNFPNDTIFMEPVFDF